MHKRLWKNKLDNIINLSKEQGDTNMGVLVYFLLLIIGITLYYAAVSYGCIYTCPKCGEKFAVTLKDMLCTMHFINEHFVKCSKCKKRTFLKGEKEIIKQ